LVKVALVMAVVLASAAMPVLADSPQTVENKPCKVEQNNPRDRSDSLFVKDAENDNADQEKAT
jgi:hypothetical protein